MVIKVNTVRQPPKRDTGDRNDVPQVIVGGGHAGLNLACWLQEKDDCSYVVLERARMLEKWKSHRWEGFQLNTPMRFSRLHGQKDDVDDMAMGRPLEEDVARWEKHAASLGLNVREGREVIKAVKEGDELFRTWTKEGDEYLSRNLVCCCGAYDKVKRPSFSSKLPARIQQLDSTEFRGPTQLKQGGVLIVGGGQSGHQIADKLSRDGTHDVYHSISAARAAVKTYRGDDIFIWLERLGALSMPRDVMLAMPPDKMKQFRYGKVPVQGPTKAISPFSLHRAGAAVLGRAVDVDGDVLVLAPDRHTSVNTMLNSYNAINAMIEAWIDKSGLAFPEHVPEPEWELPVPELLDGPGPATLPLADISNVIFATGYSTNLDWLQIPQARDDFDPVDHQPKNMISATVKGLFFSGFPWIRTAQSVNLLGFDWDHAVLSDSLLPDD